MPTHASQAHRAEAYAQHAAEHTSRFNAIADRSRRGTSDATLTGPSRPIGKSMPSSAGGVDPSCDLQVLKRSYDIRRPGTGGTSRSRDRSSRAGGKGERHGA